MDPTTETSAGIDNPRARIARMIPGSMSIPPEMIAVGRKVAADPYNGTIHVALECASNLACVGAEPLGTTNKSLTAGFKRSW